jgi:hypothetical protein
MDKRRSPVGLPLIANIGTARGLELDAGGGAIFVCPQTKIHRRITTFDLRLFLLPLSSLDRLPIHSPRFPPPFFLNPPFTLSLGTSVPVSLAARLLFLLQAESSGCPSFLPRMPFIWRGEDIVARYLSFNMGIVFPEYPLQIDISDTIVSLNLVLKRRE